MRVGSSLGSPETLGLDADSTTRAASSTTEERQATARAAYRASRDIGSPLTGAQLARQFGMSERWGRDRVAEVRDEPNGTRSGGNASRRLGTRGTNRGMDGNGDSAAAHNSDSGGRGRNGNHGTTATLSSPNGTSSHGNGNGTQQHEAPEPLDHGPARLRASGGKAAPNTRLARQPAAAVPPRKPAPRRSSSVGPTTATHRHITTLAVVVVAAVAATASYDHQRTLAALAGEGWRSYLLPLSVDGLLTAATMLMLTRRQSGEAAGALTWVALTLGVSASVAANIVGADPTLADPVLVGRLVAAWPPVALFLSLELLMRQVGNRHETDRNVSPLGNDR